MRRPIVVTHDAGLKFTAQVRSHRVTVDQPVVAGGDDVGPSPIELLGTALGTCVALYVHRFLHARGLSSAGMRVEVKQHSASNPNRIGAFGVTVTLATPLTERQTAMLERAARSCPAHETLSRAADVHVTIIAPMAPANLSVVALLT